MIQLQWSSTPECLPVIATQVNHITAADRAEEIRQLKDGQPRRLKTSNRSIAAQKYIKDCKEFF